MTVVFCVCVCVCVFFVFFFLLFFLFIDFVMLSLVFEMKQNLEASQWPTLK